MWTGKQNGCLHDQRRVFGYTLLYFLSKLMDTPSLGIVGWSGSGKTTLLEKMIALLGRQQIRVNVIKHSHHDVSLEPEHKDTARFRRAGAQEVLLASPYRLAIMRELREQEEPELAQLLQMLAPDRKSVV